MKLISTNVGKTLSFETYAGVKYKNLKFVSMPDAHDVYAMGLDAPALHIQNLPYMQTPKPAAYTDYPYAKFVDADGNAMYLGVPWVNEDSITLNSTPNAVLTLTAPTQDQLDSLRSMLTAAGIEDYKISYV